MMAIELATSLERSIAESDAKALVDSIGKILARAPEMTDDQVFEAMQGILVEYIVHMRTQILAERG